MPAVTDARLRLTSGLNNFSLRQHVILDLSDLENALRSGDAQRARFQVKALAGLLADARAQSSVDGADVSAIYIMLQNVSKIVDGTETITP